MEINKELLHKKVRRDIATLKAVGRLVDRLPDELPSPGNIHAGNWGIYLDIPYDLSLYLAVRIALGADWQSCGVYDRDDGTKFYVLRLSDTDDLALWISLRPDMNKNKCRLEKIGEHVVEQFKVVCEQEAK